MSVWSEPAHPRSSLPFHLTYGLSAMWLLSSFQILKVCFPFLHFCRTCQMPGNVGDRRGKSDSVGLLWPQPRRAHYPGSTAWWEAGGRVGGRPHNSIDFPRHASAQFCGKELCFLNVIPPAASLSSLIRLKGNSRWDGMVRQWGQRA